MSSSALEAQGMTLSVGDAASPELYTAITEINSLSGPDGSSSEIDVTDLSSTAKEFKMGLADSGSVSAEMLYIPTDTQHAALRASWLARTLKNYRITFTDSPQTTWTFAAYVTTFSTSAAVDAALTGSFTLRISGDVTEA